MYISRSRETGCYYVNLGKQKRVAWIGVFGSRDNEKWYDSRHMLKINDGIF